MKETNLSTGITIIDSRTISCGIRIENQHTEYMALAFSFEMGFYINITGTWLKVDEIEAFNKGIEIMRISLLEAKNLIEL